MAGGRRAQRHPGRHTRCGNPTPMSPSRASFLAAYALDLPGCVVLDVQTILGLGCAVGVLAQGVSWWCWRRAGDVQLDEADGRRKVWQDLMQLAGLAGPTP